MATSKTNQPSDTIYKILGSFMDPYDLEKGAHAKRLLTILFAICTVPILFIFSVICFLFDDAILSIILLVVGIIIIISLAVGRHKKNVMVLLRAIKEILKLLKPAPMVRHSE